MMVLSSPHFVKFLNEEIIILILQLPVKHHGLFKFNSEEQDFQTNYCLD